MRANSIRSAVVTLGLVLTLAPMVTAQPELGRSAALGAENLKLEGTVVSTSATALAIRTDAGETITFRLSPTSSLPSGLVGGDRVEVAYQPSATGDHQAGAVNRLSAAESVAGGPADPMGTPPPSPTPAMRETPSSTADPDPAATGARLPQTAGTGAALGLIGAVMLIAGLVLWQARRARPRTTRGAHVR